MTGKILKKIGFLAGGVLGSSFLALSVAAEDNKVTSVVYFPMPYISYNNIYIGKKLDVGIGEKFTLNLGNNNCSSSSGEQSSLSLENNATPLMLRSSESDPGKLTFKMPLYVKEVEVGQAPHTDDSTLLSVGAGYLLGSYTYLTGPNMTLGNSSDSGAIENTIQQLKATGSVGVALKLNGKEVTFPPCAEADGSTAYAHWAKVKFSGSEYIAMVCGKMKKQPFDTGVTCYPEGVSPNPSLRCEVNESEDKFYCDTSVCTGNTFYRLKNISNGIQTSFTLDKTLVKDRFCPAIEGQGLSDEEKEIILLGLMLGDTTAGIVKTQPSTAWSTTEPEKSKVFYVSTFIYDGILHNSYPTPLARIEHECEKIGLYESTIKNHITLEYEIYQEEEYTPDYSSAQSLCEAAN